MPWQFDSKLTTMDATGSGAEAKTKNLQNRGLKRRSSANNGFEKEENDSNSEELLQLQWSNHSNAFGAAMSKLRLSTCSLVFFIWLFDHVTYLKLRKKYVFAKLSKFTKCQLFSLKMVLGFRFE